MVKDVVSAFLDDDLSKLPLEIISDEATGPFLMLFSECGVPAPDQLMEVSSLRDDMSVWCHKIAQALATDNNIQLAGAIDEAEVHLLIVHAARRRVILTQRTGERAQLQRAQPVLEQLQDRRFLRKLAQIEARLLGNEER